MKPARVLALVLGTVLIVALVARLPDDVFRATQAFLLVVAAIVLLLVAAAMLVRPARALEKAVFALPLRVDGPLLGLPREADVPVVLRPLLVALVAFFVAMVGRFLRS